MRLRLAPIFAGLALWIRFAQAAEPPSPLKQRYSGARVDTAVFPEPVPIDGKRVISGPYRREGESPRDFVVLVNGTEASRMDSAQAAFHLDVDNLSYGSGAALGSGHGAEVPPVWAQLARTDWNRALSWLEWRKGVKVTGEFPRYMKFGHNLDSGSGAWPGEAGSWSVGLEVMTGGKWWLAGGSFTWHGALGALEDSIFSAAPGAFSEAGWSVTAGVPGLRYEIGAGNWEIPEYAWMERELPAYARRRRAGEIIGVYDRNALAEGFGDNLYHRVAAKAGVLSYSVLIDPDVYNAPIHDIRLTDLPIPCGSWGFGVVTDFYEAYPGVSLSLFSLEWPLAKPRGKEKPFALDLEILNFSLYFRDKSNYMMTLSAAVRIPDPLAPYLGG